MKNLRILKSNDLKVIDALLATDEVKNFNSTLKIMKIKFSVPPVDREIISPELGGVGFFNLSELRMLL